jgi:opacity protein-like surface antigen
LPATTIVPSATPDPYRVASTRGLGRIADASAGGPVAGVPYVDGIDPYAIQSPQLNAPVVNPPMAVASPVHQGSMFGEPFRGGLFRPLLPNLDNGLPSRLYLRADYLLWDVSGMALPPLVTTSPAGTAQGQAGVLGQPGTEVLFGGTEINEGSTNGWLIAGGLWITPQRNVAIEAEYIGLADHDDGYSVGSDGTMILARPFFDALAAEQNSQLVSFPGLAAGSVNVTSSSEFRSFLINARVSLCPAHGVCCPQCGQRDRTDWIVGYRNIRLEDGLRIDEQLNSQIPGTAGGSIESRDRFDTTNQFDGLQLGVIHRILLNRAWLESSLRVALGNNEQTLRVSGSSTIDQLGAVQNYPGGFLAQRTNSGVFQRNEFVLVPEIGVRLGIRLTKRLHATAGYSVLYLPSVIRAGDQIDTDINPNLFPPEAAPFAGPLRPRVLFVETDYLAHGVHLGGELHF